ncbi:MAG: Ivy family c-type lysozyme inhibitor [Caldimonas sp.]
MVKSMPWARSVAFGVTVAACGVGAQAQKAKEAWEHLKEPAFKTAYLKALGPRASTPWLAKRDGPAPEDKFIQVAGERYVMNAFCKNRDCGDNSAVILYAPDRQVVYGTVYEKGKTALIGDPPHAVGAELAKLWKKEWRSQPQ